MRGLRFAAALALASAFAPATAAAGEPASAPLAPPLAPLGFLVGSCWRGTFPDGRAADTHCFTTLYGGTFIKDEHVVSGGPQPYSGESLYRWDSAARQILFAYYASDGGFDSGRVVPVESGLDFPDQVFVEPEGNRLVLRSRWSREGADALLIVDEMQEGGGWREVRRTRLVRVGSTGPR